MPTKPLEVATLGPLPPVVVFPGQGCQRPGMGLDLLASSPRARRVFAHATQALGLDIVELCGGQDGRLELTEYAQPAILTVEIALYEALREAGLPQPARFGGHSLGETAALVAAGALPLEVAVPLVRERGRLMQEAVPEGRGGMVAVVAHALVLRRVEQLAARHGVDVANVNGASQIVLSGLSADLQAVCRALRPLLAAVDGRALSLDVSAPFHSRHMATAASGYRTHLEAVAPQLRPERARSVVSNTTGSFYLGTTEDLVERLVRQIEAPVRWDACMEALVEGAEGAAVLEVGPGRPLRALFGDHGVRVVCVSSARSVRRAARAVAA